MTKIHRTKANERLHAPALTPRCTHGARAAEGCAGGREKERQRQKRSRWKSNCRGRAAAAASSGHADAGALKLCPQALDLVDQVQHHAHTL